MKSKLFLLLLLSTFAAAHAANEAAFECSYNLYNKKDGTLISSGTFPALLDKPTRIQINNPVSGLNGFTVAVKSAFTPTMPGGDGIDYFLIDAGSGKEKQFYTTYENGNLAFGDKKVLGFVTIQRSQSFYFQHAHGWVLLGQEWYKPNLYSSILSQHGSCVGGNLNDAARYIQSMNYPSILDNEIDVTETGFAWTNVKKKCVSYGESEHGSYCEQWDEISRSGIVLPTCESITNLQMSKSK